MTYQQQLPPMKPAAPNKKPKKWTTQHWVALAVAVFLAGGLGFGAGQDDAQQASETIAAQAAEQDQADTVVPETKTVTKEVTPQGCLDALDAAEDLRGDAADVARLSARMATVNQQWPGLVLDAAQAGASFDAAAIDEISATIDDMTADTQQVNRKLNRVNDRVDSHVYDYEHAAAACRSAQ